MTLFVRSNDFSALNTVSIIYTELNTIANVQKVTDQRRLFAIRYALYHRGSIMFDLINWFLPSWARCTTADPRHAHGRRLTTAYKKRQGLVKNIWIISGFSMLVIPALPWMAALSLFTTFLSFTILDETSDEEFY